MENRLRAKLGSVRGGSLKHTVTTTIEAVNTVVVAKEPLRAPYKSGFPSTIVLRSANGSVIEPVRPNPTQMITLCGYGC